ncbi:LysE family translocator [Asaia spathodeae]|uniref:LysE family translocator n=1 Tax=Asaia spathodeae TaxID=657016 RepID=A0ABX2P2F2_9PROT|nr:LysE family translocator [Asaia spathodeae]GBR16445.1 putative threonine efflux protein [Asaia spathodeae NBRC 105894]
MQALSPAIPCFGLSSPALVSFLIFALTSSASPGPNNLLIMNVAARSGLKRTLPCILAITVAFGLMLILATMGGGAVLHRNPGLARILGILGSGWMLYLAWTIARTLPDAMNANDLPRWRTALLLCWSSPKAWMMALTTGTVYLPEGPHCPLGSIAITGLKLAIDLLSQLGWAALGMCLYRSALNPQRLMLVNRIMAALLALSALVVLI